MPLAATTTSLLSRGSYLPDIDTTRHSIQATQSLQFQREDIDASGSSTKEAKNFTPILSIYIYDFSRAITKLSMSTRKRNRNNCGLDNQRPYLLQKRTYSRPGNIRRCWKSWYAKKSQKQNRRTFRVENSVGSSLKRMAIPKKKSGHNDDMGIYRPNRLQFGTSCATDLKINRHSSQKIISTFIKNHLLAVPQVVLWSLWHGTSLHDISTIKTLLSSSV